MRFFLKQHNFSWLVSVSCHHLHRPWSQRLRNTNSLCSFLAKIKFASQQFRATQHAHFSCFSYNSILYFPCLKNARAKCEDWGWFRVTNWTTHYHKDSSNISLIMFPLNMLDSSVFSLWLFTCAGQVEGVILSNFYSLRFLVTYWCIQKCPQNHHFWEASKGSPE